MRNIFALSEAIQNCIPNSPNGMEIKREIKDVTERFLYKAPELWKPWYEEISLLLGARLGKPDVGWKQNVADLFGDKEKLK